MPEPVFSGPAVTALGLAAARAVETGRPDRLIEDPFARDLFAAAGVELPMLLDWPAPGDVVSEAQALHLHGSRYIGLRTRFYDDVVLAGARSGHRQVVLLGAGLDTRAYRLGLPADVALYEVDQRGLLDWKRDVLGRLGRPSCRRLEVGVDLRGDWAGALREAGFDISLPAAFVAEGLLAYLAAGEQAALLAEVSGLAAPGSSLTLDQLAGDPRAGGRLDELTRRSGVAMSTLIAPGPGADVAAVLTQRGWEVHGEAVATVARRYGRDLSDPLAESAAARPAPPPWLQTTFRSARRW